MIIHWECLEEMDKLIAEWIVVDSIIADIPYWTTACKWDSVIPFEPMWERLNKLIKPNGAIVLFWSEPFSSALRMSNIKNYKYDWVWKKENWTWFLNAKKQPLRNNEQISVFYKKPPTYNPQMRKWFKPYECKSWRQTENYWDQVQVVTKSNWERYPLNTIEFTRDKDKQHPTQKPVALMEYLIKTYTNEWELILDFTAWSWTTGVACKNTNRKYILIEKELDYINIIKNRLWNTLAPNVKKIKK